MSKDKTATKNTAVIIRVTPDEKKKLADKAKKKGTTVTRLILDALNLT